MSKKLFVGGLAWATTDDSLKAAFAPYGTIVEAKVICDLQTGRSRGFGFVTYDNEESAAAAREALHEQALDGRTIRIDFADDTPRKPADNKRPRRAFNDRRNADSNPRSAEKSEHTDHRYASSDYNSFVPNDGGRSSRDNRRQNKKRDRDRFDEDDRW